MPSNSEWTVGPEHAGVRLDKFLADPSRLGSRPKAASAIQRGKVFVNGRESSNGDAGRRLAAGDVVRVWIDRPGSAHRPKQIGDDRDLPIVYEDDAIVVLDKPAGILAVPLERRGDARSVFDDLKAYLHARRRGRPLVVHRIDRDTSGLVLFAKDAPSQHALKEQFKRHLPERVYHAVVYGRPQPASGTWRDRLVWDQKALIQKETHPRDPRGKDAVCRYRVVDTLRDAALVEIALVTGRRNQIRIQARLRGHMLVGEQRYVYGPDTLRTIAFPRQALHAARLVFRHPRDGREMRFEAPMPDDMTALVKRLKIVAR
ncbi:MAG TPA: RluA family pseudouridine synthase [Vicinamibacterales bacterium]|nr:RluA family pseudouridine synthase [Vicinamibacterales bacterium]